jgi:hypothetical protein
MLALRDCGIWAAKIAGRKVTHSQSTMLTREPVGETRTFEVEMLRLDRIVGSEVVVGKNFGTTD